MTNCQKKKKENSFATVIVVRDHFPMCPNMTVDKGIREFPGGLVIRTPLSHCVGPEFDPRSGN